MTKPVPKKPDPASVTKEQFIESAGHKHPTMTMHIFADFKLEHDPDYGWLRPQWAVMYKCKDTGALRKYGVIDATHASDNDRKNEEHIK